MKVEPYKSVGSLNFGESKREDCVAHYGQPKVIRTNVEGAEEFHRPIRKPHMSCRTVVDLSRFSSPFPPRGADPDVPDLDGPAIQMDPADHANTTSNGQNGPPGSAFAKKRQDSFERVVIETQWPVKFETYDVQRERCPAIKENTTKRCKRCLNTRGKANNYLKG